MSNPGVIKLAEFNMKSHRIWLDDNIGEAIHIHIDQLRIDLTIVEFEQLCVDLSRILTNLIDKPSFDVENFDARFLNLNAEKLLHIDTIEIGEANLATLRVRDDDGTKYLKDCARVKALKGEIDIDQTDFRKSNFYAQTNKQRLNQCLEFIQGNGYPVKDNYIVVVKDKNIILDGWHRAACLYYMYGAINVPVKWISFKENTFSTSDFFPIEKVPKGSKIVLYGAGVIGKAYYHQLLQSKYADVVAWVDKHYCDIKMVDDCIIKNPDDIDKLEFDYVVISVMHLPIKREIYKYLREKNVIEEKIIW